MSIKETLAELVRIDSVSSHSNAEIIAYLERRCAAMHLVTQRFPYLDDHGIEKFNLIARSSATAEVELALVGHTDTVP
jgi:acetylornithine deacetylase